jgi:hypothetical protein
VQTSSGFASCEAVYDAAAATRGARVDAHALRCGAHKLHLVTLPLCFGSLVAVSRALKFSHRFNQLFASIFVSVAVEYVSVNLHRASSSGPVVAAAGKETHASLGTETTLCSVSRSVCVHRGHRAATDLVSGCTFIKHMPYLDTSTLQYMRIHVSCAVVRCCLRCHLPPPQIVGSVHVLASIASALGAYDSSKPVMLRAVEEMSFYLRNVLREREGHGEKQERSGAKKGTSRFRRTATTEPDARRGSQGLQVQDLQRSVPSPLEIERLLAHVYTRDTAWDEMDTDERAQVDASAYMLRCQQSVFVLLMRMTASAS